MPSSACQTCARSEEHTSELQSHDNLVCRLLLEKKSSMRGEQGDQIGDALDRLCGVDGSAGASCVRFFFNDTATTEIYTLSLHDALPIYGKHTSTRRRHTRLSLLVDVCFP